jgi:hypothetical protein
VCGKTDESLLLLWSVPVETVPVGVVPLPGGVVVCVGTLPRFPCRFGRCLRVKA